MGDTVHQNFLEEKVMTLLCTSISLSTYLGTEGKIK
jgi:hypothetical protein